MARSAPTLKCPQCGYETVRELSPRVKQVIGFLVEGMTNAEIAEKLGVEVRAVKAHMNAAMRHYGSRNRVALAVCVYKQAAKHKGTIV